MNSGKVVVHVKQGDHRNMVLNFLTEGVSEASESAHVHSHVEILPLYKARRNVRLIRASNNLDSFGAKTLRWAVALLPLRIVAVNLHQLRIVNLRAKRVRNGSQIHLVAVRGQLDSIRQPASYILKELRRTPSIPPSHKPANHQLGIGVNRSERPDVASTVLFGDFWRDVLLLGIAERPDFINLDPLRRNVADGRILVFCASIPDTDKQAKNCTFRYASHARRRPNGTAFDQRCDNRYFLRHAYLVHISSIRYRFRIRKRKVAERGVLCGFLCFCPSGFCGFSSASTALLVSHSYKSALAADLSALAPHVAHDLLNDGKLRRLSGFQKHPACVLDGIKLFGSAFPLWHNSKRGTNRQSGQEDQNSNGPTTGCPESRGWYTAPDNRHPDLAATR
jgi:hypothetical protein